MLTLRIKHQLGILDQAVQRLFIYQVAQNIKRQLKHKREAKRAFDNIIKSQPFTSQHLIRKRMPFRKLAENKAGRYSLDSKLEKRADRFISF